MSAERKDWNGSWLSSELQPFYSNALSSFHVKSPFPTLSLDLESSSFSLTKAMVREKPSKPFNNFFFFFKHIICVIFNICYVSGCISLLLLQSLTPLMFKSLVRLLTSLIGEPASSITTLLYYSNLLPQNSVLERLVRHQLLDDENYLFHFLINFLRCFW